MLIDKDLRLSISGCFWLFYASKYIYRYVPQYDCRKLFEDYKSEMEIKRFAELRLK